jgi:PAS domain S-box-containing protein
MKNPSSEAGHSPRKSPLEVAALDMEGIQPNEALVRIAGYVAGLGGWSVDIAGSRIAWSDEACAIHEVPPGKSPTRDEAIGYYAPEWRETFTVAFDDCERDGTPFDLEMEVIGAKGRRSWVRVVGVPVRDEAGAIVRVQGAFQDIDERKKAELKMREHAALLDKARDAIMVRDLGSRITFWNKSAERLYGWSAQEALGQSAELLLDPDMATFDRAIQEVLTNGEWVGELAKKSKDGRHIMVESRWTLVRDEAARPQVVLVIDTDITERKRIEAQFLRSQRVESIGNLAGGIAHDLNNVLAPILMGVGLLKAEARDARDAKILGSIESSAQRGADMVRQVLAFARGVESDHLPVSPRQLVREIANVIGETFPKSINLSVDVPSDVLTIVGDQTQLHQVLLNLCVNARDAMPDGGRVTVRAHNAVLDDGLARDNGAVRAGPHVVIMVTDTGTGIPPEIQGKIFDPFFTTKGVGKGTGLGLSSVATIVKSHSGFIRLDSRPGDGTTFKLYFPAAESQLPSSASPFAAEVPRGRGECILVVDDEASVRLISQHTLEMYGYRVLTASNGVEGVEIYGERRGEIALVITDMMMPVMAGAAMIKALMDINPAVRVIATSGLEANGSVAGAAGPGVMHFLPKPYSAHTMLHTVHWALNDPAAGSAPGAKEAGLKSKDGA